MPIDGCDRSFHELANTVLPRYMEQMRQAMQAPKSLSEFAAKGEGPVTLRNRWGLDHDPKGCYVLSEDGEPVYVGISQHIIERLREHILGGDHYAATLAYRIAATKHPHGMTAALAMKDPAFLARFEESRDYLKSLDVAFIEIGNDLELYLFEAYCAMELDTGFDTGGWNTFATH